MSTGSENVKQRLCCPLARAGQVDKGGLGVSLRTTERVAQVGCVALHLINLAFVAAEYRVEVADLTGERFALDGF